MFDTLQATETLQQQYKDVSTKKQFWLHDVAVTYSEEKPEVIANTVLIMFYTVAKSTSSTGVKRLTAGLMLDLKLCFL